MRKVFTLLLMSIITSIGVWAQEKVGATASADFIVRDGGKTLIVSGKGDLTTLTTSITTTVFTNTAVGNVFVKNGEEFVSVTQGSDFSSSETYYKEIVGKKTAIENTSEKPFLSNTTYVTSSKDITSWNATKLSEKTLYFCVKNNKDVTGFTWLNSATVVNANDEYKADGVYAVEATSDKFDFKLYVASGDHKYYLQVTGDELNAYLNKYTEFTAAKTIYASTDDTNFTKIEAGSKAVYNPSAKYYTAESSNYSAYENTSTLFMTNGWVKDKTSEEKAFKELLNAKILEGATVASGSVTNTFATVRFENVGSTPLIINDEIVHAILFPTVVWDADTKVKEKNKSIVTLDLGAATNNDLAAATFKNVSDPANMTNLTLPLTKKTSVYSETSKSNEDKMVLPVNVLSGYENVILKTVTIP